MRSTDERLTRLARRKWPRARVTANDVFNGGGRETDYRLERADESPLSLGARFDDAKATLLRLLDQAH